MKSTSPMQYVKILDKIHIILYLKANCLSKYFYAKLSLLWQAPYKS